MKTLVKILVCAFICVSAFAVFCAALCSMVSALAWGHGIQNVLLVIPATFVAACYEYGCIRFVGHFYPEIIPIK